MQEPHPVSLSRLFELFMAGDSDRHAGLLAKMVRGPRAQVGAAIRGHVLGDDWMDFSVQGLAEFVRKMSGTVYVVQTPQYPEIYKVGKTGRALGARLVELSNESVLLDFAAVNSYAVHDRHRVEHATHASLMASQVPRLKEFFKTTPEILDEHIKAAVAADLACFEAQGLPLTWPVRCASAHS